MIFYFSGTGNSKHVATRLASTLGEQVVEIAAAMANDEYSYQLGNGENIGFVFPIYSWGPAPIMLRFMHRATFQGYNAASNYCYMVAVCGDDIGEAADIWQKALPCGIKGNAAFSVQMPNNYILLPGFDTDPKELEDEKINKSAARIAYIAQCVDSRTEVTDVVTGSMKWIKSRVILPLFNKYAMSDKPFTADTSLCNSCGMCMRSCPVHNITADDAGHPVWNHNCTMCLSCIHRCPTRAIEYGSITKKKGRYHFKVTRPS